MSTNAVNNDTAQSERRRASIQALASSHLEGHTPTPEFLADCELVIAGTMTLDQLRAASLARALAENRAVVGGVGGAGGNGGA